MAESSIRPARDLRRDGEEAERRSIPLLLYFSQHHCGYCKRIEEEILLPMMISGHYNERIILREVSIDEGETAIGFAGTRIDNRMLFHEYDGMVTPTLVLTDGSGHRLTGSLSGINTVEYFGWYLDSAIDEATRQLRGNRP